MMIFGRTMNEYQWFAILCAIILTLLYGACLAYYYTGNRYGSMALRQAKKEGRSQLRHLIEGREIE